MNVARRSVLAAVFAGLALASFSSSAPLGDDGTVRYKFQKPPVNSMGVASFDDWRGKPVLIDFWGTR